MRDLGAHRHQKIYLEVYGLSFLEVRRSEGGEREEKRRECLGLKTFGPLRDYYLIALRLSNLTSAM